MNCREVTEFLSDYLDGELSLRQRLLFRVHLLLCCDCRNYLASFAQTVDLIRRQGGSLPQNIGQPVPETLVQAILAARNQ